WRRKVIPYAYGNVLELALGAGANCAYYESDVQVTAIDISENMLKKAQVAAGAAQLDVRFILGNAETILFKENQFDTIVSTLSFCGYENPMRMFERVMHWLKPGGTLLLFEHGKSESETVTLLQKKANPFAKRIIGCYQDRPIMQMIQKL